MRCPVGNSPPSALSPLTPTKTLPLTNDNDNKSIEHLVSNLATAQVGCIKRFSIDAPKRRPDEAIPECNVIITGLLLCLISFYTFLYDIFLHRVTF